MHAPFEKSVTRSDYALVDTPINRRIQQRQLSGHNIYPDSWLTRHEISFVEIEKKDLAYKGREGQSNGSPIVVEKYKLIFFTVQKTGCTVWKQLARRMMGLDDWRTGPTYPNKNTGLSYLYDYNITRANELMNDPTYTRAVFVRDPKERFVSAFLDKAINTDYVSKKCCRRMKDRRKKQHCIRESKNFTTFLLETSKNCKDTHWGPQSSRIQEKYLETLDFVGHLETAARDARLLLERIGAWEEHGKSGWGKFQNESIFQSNSNVIHKTGNGTKDSFGRLAQYFTPETEPVIERRFFEDYKRAVFGLPLKKIQFLKTSTS